MHFTLQYRTVEAELLVGLLSNAPCSTTDPAVTNHHKIKQCTWEDVAMPDSGDATLSLLLDVGYVSSTYLGARGDWRVRELVKAACGLSSSGSSEMRSDDDTFLPPGHRPVPNDASSSSSSASAPRLQCTVNEKELRVLQHMIEKFRRSAEYTAFVCRPNIDTADLTDG